MEHSDSITIRALASSNGRHFRPPILPWHRARLGPIIFGNNNDNNAPARVVMGQARLPLRYISTSTIPTTTTAATTARGGEAGGGGRSAARERGVDAQVRTSRAPARRLFRKRLHRGLYGGAGLGCEKVLFPSPFFSGLSPVSLGML